MNCWTGKLEAIPNTDSTKVSLTIAGGDIAVVALLKGNVTAAKAVHAMPEQVLKDFSLKLTSFGPARQDDPEYIPGYPTTFHKVTLNYNSVPNFSSWAKLPVTEAQLAELRVDTMADVSGVGVYSCTFNLPENAVTADLKLSHHNKDVPVKVTVNGQAADVPDCMTDILPLDGLVHPGENTLEIKICSTLDNRLYREDPINLETFPPEKDLMAKFLPPFIRYDWTIRYPVGLYAAAIVPYQA